MNFKNKKQDSLNPRFTYDHDLKPVAENVKKNQDLKPIVKANPNAK